MKKVYYAHFMGIYDTPQEARDIETLKGLGLEVINPNNEITDERFKNLLKNHRLPEPNTEASYFLAFHQVFGQMVKDADVFAFRGLPNGKIPGGVSMELKVAQEENKIIIELPCSTISRSMDGEETREYLRDMGQR